MRLTSCAFSVKLASDRVELFDKLFGPEIFRVEGLKQKHDLKCVAEH